MNLKKIDFGKIDKCKLYLDNCCFNRPFDDQTSLEIHLETLAKLEIQNMLLNNVLALVWYDMLEYENSSNPFEERKTRIIKWKEKSIEIIHILEDVISKGSKFVALGLKPKDSLHLSCAIKGHCNYFITTDKGIIKKQEHINEIKILNPIDFIRLERT